MSIKHIKDIEPEVWGSRIAGYVFAGVFLGALYGAGLLLIYAVLKGAWMIVTA